MASKTVSGNGTRNDGGIVLNGGAVSENLTNLSIIDNLADVAGYGSVVVSGVPVAPLDYVDPRGVIRAKSSGGTFAYTPAPGTNFLLRAGGSNCASINGSASTVLSIPGGVEGSVINKNLKTTQVGTYATREFNLLAVPSSGNFPGLTRGTGAGTAITYRSTTNSSNPAVDDAATTSRTVPGELTYMFGAIVPSNADYKAKDSNEQ